MNTPAASLFPAESHSGNKLLGKLLLLCLAPLVLASCATRIRVPDDLEPERLLPDGAMAYVRVNPSRTGELIFPLIESYGITQAEDLLQRTESMIIAVMPFTSATEGDPRSATTGKTRRPTIYAVVTGNFPVRSIAFRLELDRHWTREGPGWVHKEEGFRLAFGSQGQLILGTAPLDAIQSAHHDGPHPVPESWSTAWDNDLAVFIPDPLALLDTSLPFDLGGLPLESMLMSIRRVDDLFDVYFGFEFASERSALVFAPLCRLFLYAMARSLWPDQSSALLAPVAWSTQGTRVGATGLRLDSTGLASMMALPFKGTTGTNGQSPSGSR